MERYLSRTGQNTSHPAASKQAKKNKKVNDQSNLGLDHETSEQFFRPQLVSGLGGSCSKLGPSGLATAKYLSSHVYSDMCQSLGDIRNLTQLLYGTYSDCPVARFVDRRLARLVG